MRDLLNTRIPLVLPTMLTIQAVGAMCGSAGVVVAVYAAADLGVKATSVGLYTAILFGTGMFVGLITNGLIARYGVIRTCQVILLIAAIGLIVVAVTSIWPFAIVSAFLIGVAIGPLNPASSHILAKHSPLEWRPLVFSIKQTGTPLGGMMAGILISPLIAPYGWQMALIIIAAIPIVLLICLQVVRNSLDEDRNPQSPIRLAGFTDALRLIIFSPQLRALAIVGYLFTFAQMSILAFTIIFLVEQNDLPATVAGVIFAIIHGSAIPARILWGAIAGRYLSSWRLLGLIGVLMSASIIAMSQVAPGWPFWLMALIAVLLGAGINGVLGLMLAEFARLAPPDRVGEAAGGGQFFLFFGIVSGPPIFGAVIEYGGGYGNAFMLIAASTLLTGLYLLITARNGKA